MKKKFAGTYLITLLIMFCAFVPFNRMEPAINNSTQVEHLEFNSKIGFAPIWYTHVYRNVDGLTPSSIVQNEGKIVGIAVIDYKQLIIQILILTMIFAIIYLFLPIKKVKKDIN